MLDAAMHFQFKGKPISCEPYGNGHINQTFLVITDQGVWYILQKINHTVFLNVPALMENITSVTRYLALNEPDERRVLTVVKTVHGDDFYVDEDGEYWRVYVFVTGSLCLEKPENARDFYISGLAFGRFQRGLADYPADSLHETIARFHDTPNRYERLMQAVREDSRGRVKLAGAEIDFALERLNKAGTLKSLQDKGILKTRVTHNDTKLNNVLLDRETREPLCVIDLDTVMPGLAAYDFGDSIRFGASTAAEDETDLSKVSLSMSLFQAFSEGFLKECGGSLSRDEILTLPDGAWTMTLECGVRFLTDFLSGDVYFRIHRPEHNLDRCRTQWKLVEDMEKKRGELDRIISWLG